MTEANVLDYENLSCGGEATAICLVPTGRDSKAHGKRRRSADLGLCQCEQSAESAGQWRWFGSSRVVVPPLSEIDPDFILPGVALDPRLPEAGWFRLAEG